MCTLEWPSKPGLIFACARVSGQSSATNHAGGVKIGTYFLHAYHPMVLWGLLGSLVVPAFSGLSPWSPFVLPSKWARRRSLTRQVISCIVVTIVQRIANILLHDRFRSIRGSKQSFALIRIASFVHGWAWASLIIQRQYFLHICFSWLRWNDRRLSITAFCCY